MGNVFQKKPIDESVRIFVDTTVATCRVIIFSKNFCPYCRRAKELLEMYPIRKGDYEVIELEKRPDMSSIQDYLLELTGARTVCHFFCYYIKLRYHFCLLFIWRDLL